MNQGRHTPLNRPSAERFPPLPASPTPPSPPLQQAATPVSQGPANLNPTYAPPPGPPPRSATASIFDPLARPSASTSTSTFSTPPTLPPRSTTTVKPVYDPHAYTQSTEAEDLDAAIQASLTDAYPPPPGPPPNLPPRRVTTQTTGALNSSTPGPAVSTPPRANQPPNTNTPEREDPTRLEPWQRASSDSPPPYTPAPDFRAGEEILETGPRRPFQNVNQARPVNGPGPGYFPRTRSTSQPDLAQGFFSGASPNRASGSSSGHQAPENESPTDIPTPGRPLLRDGRVLVYPRNFECYKCE